MFHRSGPFIEYRRPVELSRKTRVPGGTRQLPVYLQAGQVEVHIRAVGEQRRLLPDRHANAAQIRQVLHVPLGPVGGGIESGVVLGRVVACSLVLPVENGDVHAVVVAHQGFYRHRFDMRLVGQLPQVDQDIVAVGAQNEIGILHRKIPQQTGKVGIPGDVDARFVVEHR